MSRELARDRAQAFQPQCACRPAPRPCAPSSRRPPRPATLHQHDQHVFAVTQGCRLLLPAKANTKALLACPACPPPAGRCPWGWTRTPTTTSPPPTPAPSPSPSRAPGGAAPSAAQVWPGGGALPSDAGMRSDMIACTAGGMQPPPRAQLLTECLAFPTVLQRRPLRAEWRQAHRALPARLRRKHCTWPAPPC